MWYIAGDNSTCALIGILNGDNSCADITSCEIGEGEVIPYIPFSTTGNTTGLVKILPMQMNISIV